jgi:hypothetical protein
VMLLIPSIWVGMRECSLHGALSAVCSRCLTHPCAACCTCQRCTTEDTDMMEMESKQECTGGGGDFSLAAAPAFSSDEERKEIPAAAAATGQLLHE